MNKVRWGVLSTAKIGVKKVIPAMQQGAYCEISAIASRNLDHAQTVARQLGIASAYGSYDELLADPAIDAVYIPLPNHLHVPWSIKALEAGKHVLCEKPVGLSVAEAEQLLAAARSHPHLKIMEAFMYRFHPQWLRARELVSDGRIGSLQTIDSFFSYYNDDPGNIRNMSDIGGGALMDIGCYSLSLARFIFASEPQRVFGNMELDPEFKIDRLTSGILEFARGTSTFTCSTQMAPYQRVNILGSTGRIEIEIPFNAPPDQPCRIWHQHDGGIDEIVFDLCDQYTIQGDLISRAILDDSEVPTPLQDAVANMQLLEAIIRSAKSGAWTDLEPAD
ncbi:MAG: Gfo/Idh/MocA family oxidoreductase [Gammaproteobacteria bacterium]|nr:Gfo/Idh/MocA family oxidoreductase [Gammaproteobacteria bacterium]